MKRIFLSLAITLLMSSAGICATTPAPSNAVLQKIIAQLNAPTVQSRVAALKQLAAFGPKAAKAVPAIVDALNENRAESANFSSTKPVSPVITDAALEALKAIGPAAHDAAPYLTPLLRDRNELFRRVQVLETLNAIGPCADSTVALMRVVAEEGKFTAPRTLAIALIGKVDPPALEAVDMLHEITEDPTDKKAKAEAKKAMDSILARCSTTPTKAASATNTAAEQKLRALRFDLAPTKDSETRRKALSTIGELGPNAALLVPTLMQMIGDPDNSVRYDAIDALADIGKPSMVAIPALVNKLMSCPDSTERGIYARAIAKIDRSGKRTLPILQESLEDPFKARLAIEVLQEIGTDETTSIAQKIRQRWRIK